VDPQEARERFVKSLLDKMDDTNFPSNELLSRVEASIGTTDELTDYAERLIKKVEDTRFPSNELLGRVEGVVARLAAAGDDR
jgi:hypothetical protein